MAAESIQDRRIREAVEVLAGIRKSDGGKALTQAELNVVRELIATTKAEVSGAERQLAALSKQIEAAQRAIQSIVAIDPSRFASNNVFAKKANGLVPGPNNPVGKFLRDDGAWATPDAGAEYAYGVLASDYVLTSSTSAQKLFNWTSNGALALDAGIYLFQCTVYITDMSATSGNGSFGLLGAGTATLARILQHSHGLDSSTPLLPSPNSGSGNVSGAWGGGTVTGGTGTGLILTVQGSFDVTVAGTIIPSFALTTAAAAIVKAGSFFRCLRIGATGVQEKGAWS